jgi:hypothetical protein
MVISVPMLVGVMGLNPTWDLNDCVLWSEYCGDCRKFVKDCLQI